MGVIVWHGIFFVNVVEMCQLFSNICGIYYISYLKYHAGCLIYNSNHNFNIYDYIYNWHWQIYFNKYSIPIYLI